MWDLVPWPGFGPRSPTLGVWRYGVLATGPPRKSLNWIIKYCLSVKKIQLCLGSSNLPLFPLFFLLYLLHLFIFSLVSAITLISPIITRMLTSNGVLSSRKQWFPKRITSFGKVWNVRYYCWASDGLWLQHWTALGHAWAGTACVYSLMFLLLCVGLHISISGNYKQCVWQSMVWGPLPRALYASWDGWHWKWMITDHFS